MASVEAGRLTAHQRRIHGIAGVLLVNGRVKPPRFAKYDTGTASRQSERSDFLNLIAEKLGGSRAEASEFVWKVQHETGAHPSMRCIYEGLEPMKYPYDTKVIAQRAARIEKELAARPKVYQRSQRRRRKRGVSIVYTPMGGMSGGRKRRG